MRKNCRIMTPETLRDINVCAAFTGYRPEKIRLSSSNPAIETEIKNALRVALIGLYRRGYRFFFSGMAEGFDLWAAGEVVGLRNSGECPDMELIAVIPFRAQPDKFSPHFRTLYHMALEEASETVILSERYYRGCYEARNDYLVDHSSQVVCYFDGQAGGTKYTVRRARSKGIPVINLYGPPTLF